MGVGARIGRVLPGVASLRGYRRSWLRPDVLAGVTVAAYLVPQVMAYAGLAGLPAVAGLWAAVVALVGYALLGTSRLLSAGPESTTALMTAVVVAPLAGGDPGRYAELAGLLALAVGAVCLVAGLLRLGVVADLLSRPVLVGYLAGVAVTMIVGQLGRVTGVPVSGSTLRAELASFVRHLDQAQPATVAVAALVLAFLVAAARFAPRWPGPLLAVLLATAGVAAFGLQARGVGVVGAIPAGPPALGWPPAARADLLALALPAAAVSVVAFTDDVLTARAFAQPGQRIDGNRELVALGAANVGASLVAGFPVSSSGSRTAIAALMRARSQLYSVVGALTVLVTLVLLRPVLARFPTAALGALVVFAAARLVDVAEFRRIARFRRGELVITLATVAGVLVLGVLDGIAVAVAISILDLLRRVARPHDAVQGFVPGLPGMHDVDDFPTARFLPGLVVYRYDAPLFFANAEDFLRRAVDAVAAGGATEWLVLNTEAIVETDITGVDALDALREEMARRGVVLALARVKQDLLDDLVAAGFVERLGAGRIFPTLPAAVHAYLDEYGVRHGGLPAGVTLREVPPSPLL